MLRVVENTYQIPLAAGDEVEWQLLRGTYWLYKIGVERPVFAGPTVRRDGLKPNGKQPVLVGLVAENKSKGFRLVLSA